MKNSGEKSLMRIRNFRREIRKIEDEIRALEQDLETEGLTNGYWPESRLYSPSENDEHEKSAKTRQKDIDFIVPWQMK